MIKNRLVENYYFMPNIETQTKSNPSGGPSIKELWREHQFSSEELTRYSRKLALGLIVICWFLKLASSSLPPPIYWVLNLAILFFLCDIIHYFVGAEVLHLFVRSQEIEMQRKHGVLNLNHPIRIPPWLGSLYASCLSWSFGTSYFPWVCGGGMLWILAKESEKAFAELILLKGCKTVRHWRIFNLCNLNGMRSNPRPIS